ncbi:phasin family protein [Sphingomonas sp. MMS24-JH45]
MSNASDPGAFFRDMLGQWEKMANSFGNDAMKRKEFARGMQGATAASLQMQAAFRDTMERALSAANLPTRTDVEALAARVDAIEASLARIEAALTAANGGVKAAAKKEAGKDKPTRGRKPAATE